MLVTACSITELLYQDDSEPWHAADDLELTEELVSADDLAHFFWT